VALALPSAVWASDWPLFRGDPQLTGVSEEALPDDLELLWVFATEEEGFEATATVAGETVYVGSLDGHLYAVTLEGGVERWVYAAGAPIKTAPSVHEGTVYFGDEDGVFHAIDRTSGKERWRFEAGAEINSSANFAAGCAVFGSHDESIYCLDTDDGTLRWKVETQGYVFGMPAVADGHVFSAGCETIREAEIGAYVGASPALRDGRAYFGTFDNRVVAIELASGETLWAYRNPDRQFPFLSSVAVDGTLAVVGGRDKLIVALGVDDGKPVWKYSAGARVDSSPVIVGDRVFVGIQSGEIVALGLESGEVAWRFDTGSPIVASPSVAAGRLLIGTVDGQLYCFGGSGDERKNDER